MKNKLIYLFALFFSISGADMTKAGQAPGTGKVGGKSTPLSWKQGSGPSGIKASEIPKSEHITKEWIKKGGKGKDSMFSIDIPSEYKKVCFELVNPVDGKPLDRETLKGISYKVMERKRIGNDRARYIVKDGNLCHPVKSRSMKGYYVRFIEGNKDRHYGLSIRGLR